MFDCSGSFKGLPGFGIQGRKNLESIQCKNMCDVKKLVNFTNLTIITLQDKMVNRKSSSFAFFKDQ